MAIMRLILLLFFILSCKAPTEDCYCGNLYVAGNEPFTYLALSTDDGNYRIECSTNLGKELWGMQGQSINVCDYNIELIEL